MYRKKIDAYIDSHKDQMLEDLKSLVRINSIKGVASKGKPYGEGPTKALEAAQTMLSKYGFQTTNYDNRVITGDLSNREKHLDILAHLDVVPVTPDWTVTQPFDPIVKEGRIYGRGTCDDKGPAIAALYAMRAVKELGIPLTKNVRLILGSDEECGSSDVEYYYSMEEEAPMTFTPDANYPLINIEKGRLAATYSAQLKTGSWPEVVMIQGGDKENVVPAKCCAQVKGLTEKVLKRAIAKDNSGVTFSYHIVSEQSPLNDGKEDLMIEAKGVAAHASLPEGGYNAVSAMLGLLSRLPLGEGEVTSSIRGLAQKFPFGDVHGTALGVEMEDETSGHLTMNLGIISLKEGHLEIVIDSRVPICGNDENVTEVVKKAMSECLLTQSAGVLSKPHYVPADSPLVQKLLESYERYTGKKGEALAIGGGTYVHHLKNGVAFGCEVEGVDNHMHGDDEFMEVEVLLMSAKIFADAICKLCQ